MGTAFIDESCGLPVDRQRHFMNHPDVFPYYWIDAVDTLGDPVMDRVMPLPWHIVDANTVITWEDAGMSCNVIASHKNFLFALGMKELAEDGVTDVEYRDKVWWSHPAEPNGIPFSWRPTSAEPSSIAGYVTLGRGGKIIGGESLRDSFVIYSEDAMNVMDYVGDALGWRRRTVSASANLMGKEGVVEVKGRSTGATTSWPDGNTMQSIVHKGLGLGCCQRQQQPQTELGGSLRKLQRGLVCGAISHGWVLTRLCL